MKNLGVSFEVYNFAHRASGMVPIRLCSDKSSHRTDLASNSGTPHTRRNFRPTEYIFGVLQTCQGLHLRKGRAMLMMSVTEWFVHFFGPERLSRRNFKHKIRHLIQVTTPQSSAQTRANKNVHGSSASDETFSTPTELRWLHKEEGATHK